MTENNMPELKPATMAGLKVKPLEWAGGDVKTATGLMMQVQGVVIPSDRVAGFEAERAAAILAAIEPAPVTLESALVDDDDPYTRDATEVEETMLANIVSLRSERDALAAEVARLREALEPSGYTKAAYMGEVRDDGAGGRIVSWTAIKAVMAMIRARAAQADYEARILAAVEPAPVALAAALELPEIAALVSEVARCRNHISTNPTTNQVIAIGSWLTAALAALKGGDA